MKLHETWVNLKFSHHFHRCHRLKSIPIPQSDKHWKKYPDSPNFPLRLATQDSDVGFLRIQQENVFSGKANKKDNSKREVQIHVHSDLYTLRTLKIGPFRWFEFTSNSQSKGGASRPEHLSVLGDHDLQGSSFVCTFLLLLAKQIYFGAFSF